MRKHLRKIRKNRYWVVVCNVFRVALLEKWCYFSNFHFFRKNIFPLSSDRLNKCYKGSLIFPKHFLTTLKLISSYPGLLLVFNEKKASFNSFIDSEFFPSYCVFDLRN